MQARRAEILIYYNGKNISAALAESLIDLSYTDNPSGQLDDLQITLEDRNQKWQGPWNPAAGDTITATIQTINWDDEQVKSFPLGTFEVDSATLNGPPDTVQIKSLSLPTDAAVLREARSKAWENLSLLAIAQDIAKTADLTLLFEATDNPSYERLDQTEQSDMSFLLDLCTKEGIALKISTGKLVLFDEADYESRSAITTITRGKDYVIGYSFGWGVTDAPYRACQLSYNDSKSNIQATYVPPNAPDQGPILKINESVTSEAEALRIARKRLRQENKNFGRASLQLDGDIRMSTGLTIHLSGWGRYDGKYIIESAGHSINGSGYSTGIEIRKVLGW